MASCRPLIALALVGASCGGEPRTREPRKPSPTLEPDGPAVGVIDLDPAAPDDSIEPDPHDHDHDHDDIEYSCEDVIRDLASYPPALPDNAPERDWNLAIRAHILEEDCEHMWTYDDKQCLATKGPASCVALLPNDIGERLTMLTKLGEKIAEAQGKPATIGCKQVVDAHYGTARWQGRLEGFPAKERNQMIADSRVLMQKACKIEAWRPATRACLSLGGGDLCFFNTNIRRMWGYPADGSVRTLGIPDCDAYDAAVTRLATCQKLPEHARHALARLNASLKAQIASASPAERVQRGQGCRAGLETVEGVLESHGC
jgi:hypothetical protein